VQITPVEIDRAIANAEGDASTRVLVSEIVIPVGEAVKSSVIALARNVRDNLLTDADFATAARTYSSAASAGKGGKIDWIPASSLPAVVASQLLRLKPGEISQPIDMDGAIGIFQLRDMQKASTPKAGNTLDYAVYLLPGGKGAVAEAAKIRSKVSICNDLYGIAKGQPEDRLSFTSLPVSQVPSNIALQLAAMDPGESIDYPQGATHAFLMLCARNPVGAAAASREQVQADLTNQRLAAMADTYMEELRSEAFIREP
jgi:peptidyl-prolyl cis-trans isomerase SurA